MPRRDIDVRLLETELSDRSGIETVAGDLALWRGHYEGEKRKQLVCWLLRAAARAQSGAWCPAMGAVEVYGDLAARATWLGEALTKATSRVRS